MSCCSSSRVLVLCLLARRHGRLGNLMKLSHQNLFHLFFSCFDKSKYLCAVKKDLIRSLKRWTLKEALHAWKSVSWVEFVLTVREGRSASVRERNVCKKDYFLSFWLQRFVLNLISAFWGLRGFDLFPKFGGFGLCLPKEMWLLKEEKDGDTLFIYLYCVNNLLNDMIYFRN